MIKKRLNVTGIIILVVSLALIQAGVGYLISPAFTQAVVETLNTAAGTKVIVEKVHVWPLTLSFSMDGLKIFDPDAPEKRIAEIKKASFRLSPLALLCKRIVFSHIKANGVELDLEGQPDGSFNIQKLSRAGAGRKQGGITAMWDRLRGGKDWFKRIYDIIKEKSSKKSAEELKAEKEEERKVIKMVSELPRGRRVVFKTVRDYVFEIRELDLNNTRIHLRDGNNVTDIENAGIRIRGAAFDPDKGGKFESIRMRGRVSNVGNHAGDIKLEYSSVPGWGGRKTDFEFAAKDLDVTAFKFVYRDSLPVDIVKGRLDIVTKTRIEGEKLDSRNKIELRDHQFAGRLGRQLSLGTLAGPVIVEALNAINPVKLDFDITGTVDKPEFSGFQKSLDGAIKPYVDKMGSDVQEKGLAALQNMFRKDKTASGGGK